VPFQGAGTPDPQFRRGQLMPKKYQKNLIITIQGKINNADAPLVMTTYYSNFARQLPMSILDLGAV